MNEGKSLSNPAPTSLLLYKENPETSLSRGFHKDLLRTLSVARFSFRVIHHGMEF